MTKQTPTKDKALPGSSLRLNDGCNKSGSTTNRSPTTSKKGGNRPPWGLSTGRHWSRSLSHGRFNGEITNEAQEPGRLDLWDRICCEAMPAAETRRKPPSDLRIRPGAQTVWRAPVSQDRRRRWNLASMQSLS